MSVIELHETACSASYFCFGEQKINTICGCGNCCGEYDVFFNEGDTIKSEKGLYYRRNR